MHLKVLANGGTGTGKSYFGLGFPKVAWLLTEPGNLVLLDTHPHLKQNVAWSEEFIPSPIEDIKVTFDRLNKAILRAHTECKEGKIDTLFLDNVSYLFENRWIYINQYETLRAGGGALDTRGMYGTLGRWGYKFMLMSILSFPKNVVVSCHEMTESDEAMNKKVDKTTPIVPLILGGMREKIAGMFSASIYLDKKRTGQDKYQYLARCQKGNLREAKNRLGLPELIENISYDSIISNIKKGSK